MKLHYYNKTEVQQGGNQFFMVKYWRYDVTACGLRRQEDDFHLDAAKTPEQVTCLKCLAILAKQRMNT